MCHVCTPDENGLINPLMFAAAWNLDEILQAKSKVSKTIEGGMLYKTLPTILFQIFFKNILNFKVIIKSIVDPDENF